MDLLGIQVYFVCICPLIAILGTTSANIIKVGSSEIYLSTRQVDFKLVFLPRDGARFCIFVSDAFK